MSSRSLTLPLALVAGALVATIVTPALAPDAHAQGAAKREYKVVTVTATAGSQDRIKTAQEEALNKLAAEGWRLVGTSAMPASNMSPTVAIFLYLER